MPVLRQLEEVLVLAARPPALTTAPLAAALSILCRWRRIGD